MSSNSEEISLKDLWKKVIRISNSRKKNFTWLLLFIMTLSSAYFIKVIIKPSYVSEVILKSRILKKDALSKILENYNNAIQDGDYTNLEKLQPVFENSFIRKLDAQEIKADISSPDRADPTKYYRLITYYSQKPGKNNGENIDIVIDDIKHNAAMDHDISIGKEKTIEAIAELDSLLMTALPAGSSFKNRIEGNSSMIILNDLYRSLSELLSRKSQLKTELVYYQEDNLIYKISPLVLSKKISFPLIIFVIGFVVWFVLCTFWVGGVIIFGDDE